MPYKSAERGRIRALEYLRKRTANGWAPDPAHRRALRQKRLEVINSQRRELRHERRNWIDSQKDKPYADCGSSFPACCMDFDHRPGEIKKFDIGSGGNRNLTLVKAEMKKCDLVCANCHRIRTKNRGWAWANRKRKEHHV